MDETPFLARQRWRELQFSVCGSTEAVELLLYFYPPGLAAGREAGHGVSRAGCAAAAAPVRLQQSSALGFAHSGLPQHNDWSKSSLLATSDAR